MEDRTGEGHYKEICSRNGMVENNVCVCVCVREREGERGVSVREGNYAIILSLSTSHPFFATSWESDKGKRAYKREGGGRDMT